VVKVPYEEKPLAITVVSEGEKEGFDLSSLVNILMQLIPLFIVLALIPLVLSLIRR